MLSKVTISLGEEKKSRVLLILCASCICGIDVLCTRWPIAQLNQFDKARDESEQGVVADFQHETVQSRA